MFLTSVTYQVKQVRGVLISNGLVGEPEAQAPTTDELPGEDEGPAASEATDDG